MNSDEQIIEELRHASDGRFYMSESDYPFETIKWDGQTEISPAFLYGLTGEPTDSAIQEIDIASFLSGTLADLATLIQANLADVKIYKVGRINMPVYVVGRSPNGNWLGLSTRVVET